MKIYLVGGAVRDQLLGRAVKEKDYVVVGAKPAHLLAKGFRPVGKDFPVFLHPDTKEEYALARLERKVGVGYTGFECDASDAVRLEDDLLRRDLTINAMAQDSDGQLIDPYGGLADLKNRILRHVSPAFREDPLRVLRVARFAARYYSFGFTIAAETRELLRQMVREGELSHLTPERVWLELHKSLTEDHPRVFFEVLRTCGALEQLFPEIDALFGIPSPMHWHPEIDSGVHTLMVLQQAAQLSNSSRVRFAALVHDLGKALTSASNWPRHIGHAEAGVAPIKALCQRFKVPKEYQGLAVLAARHHIQVHEAFNMRPQRLVKLLKEMDAFRRQERFDELLLVCRADAQGRLGNQDDVYPQGALMKQLMEELKHISIKDCTSKGMKGNEIGRILEERREKLANDLLPKIKSRLQAPMRTKRQE